MSRVLIFRARIPEPHNRVQGSGFLFGLGVRVGLRLPDELRLSGSGSFLHRRRRFFGTGRHDGAHRRVRIIEDLCLFDPHIADEQRVPDSQRGHIELHMLRNIHRQYFDLELPKHMVALEADFGTGRVSSVSNDEILDRYRMIKLLTHFEDPD